MSLQIIEALQDLERELDHDISVKQAEILKVRRALDALSIPPGKIVELESARDVRTYLSDRAEANRKFVVGWLRKKRKKRESK